MDADLFEVKPRCFPPKFTLPKPIFTFTRSWFQKSSRQSPGEQGERAEPRGLPLAPSTGRGSGDWRGHPR